jgi:hypothetical protein
VLLRQVETNVDCYEHILSTGRLQTKIFFTSTGRKFSTLDRVLIKLYNDQRNVQVFNLFIYLLLPYMFRVSISPSSEASVQLRQWFKSPGYGVSARALTPYPGDLPAPE